MRKEFLEPPEAYCARMGSSLFSENALFFIFIIDFTFQDELKVLTNIVEFHLPVDIGCVLEVEWTMTSKICHKNKHNFMIVAGELAKGEAVEIKITV